jgi:hypothetical protein
MVFMDKFKITKKSFKKQYNQTLDDYLDVCDWVTHIDDKSVCGFVYGILTKNDIDKPIPVEEFYDLYLEKYKQKLIDKNGDKMLSIEEVTDLVYDLLVELFSR